MAGEQGITEIKKKGLRFANEAQSKELSFWTNALITDNPFTSKGGSGVGFIFCV